VSPRDGLVATGGWRAAASWVVLLSATVFLSVTRAPGWADDVELASLTYPGSVPARSSFSARLRIANHGLTALGACDPKVENAPFPGNCVALAYRKDKRPPRLSFSKVELLPLPGRALPLQPAGSIEASVELPTPDRKGDYVIYLYLIVNRNGQAHWREFPVNVTVGRRPADISRRIFTAQALIGLYVLATVGMLWCVRRRRQKTDC
jgi:hypothetical protein